jgi:hypothetical protein
MFFPWLTSSGITFSRKITVRSHCVALLDAIRATRLGSTENSSDTQQHSTISKEESDVATPQCSSVAGAVFSVSLLIVRGLASASAPARVLFKGKKEHSVAKALSSKQAVL